MSMTMLDKATAKTASMPHILSPDPDWWRGAVIYQIYPRSFQDSNGDGIGDLNGITSRLDYIASLGADAIWISPFFRSPMDDFGYDVSDYRDVDPIFGTLADFDRLLAEAHARDIRVMIDLVISHTSDRHAWFAESRASRNNAKADWYAWADPKPDGSPPNNWLSVFGGSSWEWEARRKQYYLHNFLISQPDLNFHNPDVQDAVLGAARFWLDRGVDGFRLDTVNFYFHDPELRDNPPLSDSVEVATVPNINPYGYQLHLFDKNRPENLQFLERLRALMDEYPAVTAVGELGTDHDVYELTAAYTEEGRRIHMAYSFDLLGPRGDATFIRRTVEGMERGVGSGWPSWALSNHDVKRVVSRWHAEDDADRFAPLAIAMVTSLRGTPCIYQGEELGLTEAEVPFERLQDPYGKRFWPEYKGRDGCRTPHPWRSDNLAAGFSTNEPWLPLPPEHQHRAVAEQEDRSGSALEATRRFLWWRKESEALRIGTIRFLDTQEPVLAFIRKSEDESILCVFNLGRDPVQVSLPTISGTRPLDGHGFGGRLDGRTVMLAGRDAFFGTLHD